MTCLAVVIASIVACTADANNLTPAQCGCDAAAVTEGPAVYTRCDVPVTSVRTTGPCSAMAAPQSALVIMNGVAYEEIVRMLPLADGVCTLDVTFANGFTYSNSFTITGQWEACGSDPHGCGEYLMLPIYELLIDECGDAGLYAPPSDGGDAGADGE